MQNEKLVMACCLLEDGKDVGIVEVDLIAPSTVDTRFKLLSDGQYEKAVESLKLKGHPVRLKIVDILMQGEFAVHEIADICDTSPNQTCEHLRLLKGRGLLTTQREGRTVFYKIRSPQLSGLIECIRQNYNK